MHVFRQVQSQTSTQSSTRGSSVFDQMRVNQKSSPALQEEKTEIKPRGRSKLLPTTKKVNRPITVLPQKFIKEYFLVQYMILNTNLNILLALSMGRFQRLTFFSIIEK